ncbi:sensor domain-containing diguanylate cyclase [Paenibacillus rhizovicinus]|uniref:Sensor domain-containing diguanylate cyclase n=2 Tax=Paenibacillus rhizovicinus TaxID=2704463 RepID=A0A6C0P9R4_9BACL|nr:sensor domain-containing diguanylate cyclase [Paenibacillus rhizovicinus]
MLRMMSSKDMTMSNSAARWEIDILEAQQPDVWLPKGDFLANHEYIVRGLLKEAWNRWHSQAMTISSPLLHHHMQLLDAEGGLLIESAIGDDLPNTGTEAILAPLNSRRSTGCIARLKLASADKTESFLLPLLEAAALTMQEMYDHAYDLLIVRQMMNQQQIIDKEARGRDYLFQAAKRLHDQNDVYSVLHVLLDDVEVMYPGAKVNLYLSQDFVYSDSRVKPLLLRHTNDDLNANAFLTGKPVTADEDGGGIKLAIPLRGNQAVYGVLSLSLQQRWDEFEHRSMVMLVDTAGSAFENAKLYEQSNLLISELQLINELTKRLNQSLRLNEVFDFALTELMTIFKADYCHLLQISNDGSNFQIMASNVPMTDTESYSTSTGFGGIVIRTKEPLIISDYWSTRVVDSKLMDASGARSLIAAPVMAGSAVVGVIMVSHQSPNFFSYENYKLLQVLSTHIGLAVSNASLHAEVRRMVITDNLTGLHARHYLNEQIHLRQRKDRCGSLVLVDIDHFKRVNDTFGHLIGDQILVAVSDVIRNCIRDTDIAARWGGEELAVYLPQIRTGQAYRIAERIRSTVEGQTDPTVTVSCGISEWSFDEEKISVESLFYRADMALYEAKKNGRNRICVG